MFFPESILEEIKSRVDFLAFISRYVDLKRAGANYKGLCSFHQEKTPSFMVSPNKAIYKCFGCGVCAVTCPEGALSMKLVRPITHLTGAAS